MLNFKKNKKKLIIAEIGQGHKNSIKEAKKLIDLTARSGADIIKFQTHMLMQSLPTTKSLEKDLILSTKQDLIIGNLVSSQKTNGEN